MALKAGMTDKQAFPVAKFEVKGALSFMIGEFPPHSKANLKVLCS